MIEQLWIKNLGVIGNAQLTFSPNFTVLTGETGAGKSMVLNSIALLMGKKAGQDLVRHNAQECVVNGVFTASANHPALTVVEEAGGMADEDEIMLSRTLTLFNTNEKTKARSYSWVGGMPVPAGILAKAADTLVTVHGQSDQLLLRSSAAQLELVDRYGPAKHAEKVQQFQKLLKEINHLKSELEQWEDSQLQRELELQHLQTGLEKLEELEPQAGEEEDLIREIEKLSNVEDLRLAVNEAYSALSGDEEDYGHSNPGADLQLVTALRAVENAVEMDDALSGLIEMLNQARTLTREAAGELSAYLQDLNADPIRLERNQQRLADLRHGYRNWATGVDDWLEWGRNAAVRVGELSGPNNRGDQLKNQIKEKEIQLRDLGDELHQTRSKLAAKLTRETQAELGKLGMGKAGFVINVSRTDKPSSTGFDQVLFGLGEGSGGQPRPLKQGASGGELSRIMLALEVVLAGKNSQNDAMTFIFDEVDAGIGGETAQAIGKRLAQLAKSAQVIVVTHLPQVAAWADQHLVVRKNEKGNQIDTGVVAVAGADRVKEIARMLSGQANSESAQRHAEELLAHSKLG